MGVTIIIINCSTLVSSCLYSSYQVFFLTKFYFIRSSCLVLFCTYLLHVSIRYLAVDIDEYH